MSETTETPDMPDQPTRGAPEAAAPEAAEPDAALVHVVEALLFASDAPVEASRLQDVLGLGSAAEARDLVEALRHRMQADGRALQVVEVGGGFRLMTRPEVAPWLVKLARSRTRSRLSRPALETLAIVAYRQPVSRPEVDAIRGVNSEGVLDNLLDRRMVRIAGRKDSPGRPFLYETTRDFLIAFGLRDLADLPKPDGELIMPEIGTPGAQAELPEVDAAAPAAEAPALHGEPATASAARADSTTADARPTANAKAAAAAAVPTEVEPEPPAALAEPSVTAADPVAPGEPSRETAAGSPRAEGMSAPDPHQQDPGASGPDVPARG
jgi:segregation and condensation protein B